MVDSYRNYANINNIEDREMNSDIRPRFKETKKCIKGIDYEVRKNFLNSILFTRIDIP